MNVSSSWFQLHRVLLIRCSNTSDLAFDIDLDSTGIRTAEFKVKIIESSVKFGNFDI